MIEIKTFEQYAMDTRIKDIPWSVFSNSSYFFSRISEAELDRMQGTLEASSQALRPGERAVCAACAFLQGHQNETDEVLCTALQMNMKIGHYDALRAVIATGRASLLRSFIQGMSPEVLEDTLAGVTLHCLYNAAISLGEVSMLAVLADCVPTAVKAIQANTEYMHQYWRLAAYHGQLEVLQYLEKELDPDDFMALISKNGYVFYEQAVSGFRKDAEHRYISVLHYLESCLPGTAEDIILANGCKILNRALGSRQPAIIAYFLSYPRVFARAEIYTDGLYLKAIETFIHHQLETWSNAVPSDLSQTDLDLALLFVRFFIRKDSLQACEHLHRLLQMPWIAERAHMALFSEQAAASSDTDLRNGLLRFALATGRGRGTAAKYLLSLPAVRHIAKEQDFYRSDTPHKFDMEVCINDYDALSLTGINDLVNSQKADCIYRLYQLSETMTLSESGSYVCPPDLTPEFFRDYVTCAKDDIDLHCQLLRHLFASRTGLMKLFALLQQGFVILPDSSEQELVASAIGFIRWRFQLQPANPEEQAAFESFLKQLDVLLEPNASSISVSQMPDFFHAVLLKHFSEHYVYLGKNQSPDLLEKAKQVWNKALEKDDLHNCGYYYFLMKTCGFQIAYRRFIEFTFNHFFTSDKENMRKLSLFLLDLYAEKPRDNELVSRACTIAACMAKDLLKKDFSLNLDKIDKLYSIHSMDFDCYWREQKPLEALSLSTFIKVAGLLATRFERYDFLDVLLQLSRQTVPIHRCLDDFPLNPRLMYRPSVEIKMDVTRSVGNQHGIFQDTLDDIFSVFSSPEKFDLFFEDLDKKLERKLEHVPVVPQELLKNNINLCEQNYPGQDTMDWYLSLKPEERKLNQALHLTLLEMEHSQGYNRPLGEYDEGVPRFHGFVPSDKADELVKDGYRFKESSLDLPGNCHGVDAHRIQLAALDFFIEQGIIRLPEGKTVRDLLAYIIDNKLWSRLFDHFTGDFGSPHFVMSWMRNASRFPNVQKAAVFSFCKSMNKYMQRLPAENNPWTYERLIMMQNCYEEQFSTAMPRVTVDAIAHNASCEYVEDKRKNLKWAIFFKEPKRAVQAACPEQASQSQSASSSLS